MTASKLLILLACALGVRGLVLSPPSAELALRAEAPSPTPECQLMAKALRRVARKEARAEYWLMIANGLNQPGGATANLIQDAEVQRQEAFALAQAQYQARVAACAQLGHGPYAPQIESLDFSASITNPLLMFVPGTTRVYEKRTEAGLERLESTTLEDLVVIEGVACRVVHDVETLDGVLTEDTYDWFAQKSDGDVWYFGESTKHFEDGFLDGLEGSWREGKDGARAGIAMREAPSPGEVYRQEYKANEAEDIAKVISVNETVTTAAGTFTNCVLIEEWSPLENELEWKYYAPGVGFVLELNPVTGERLELIEIVKN